MTSLKIIAWNYRGISNSQTINRIQDLIRSRSPDIMCLVKTQADKERINRFCLKFVQGWIWVAIPSTGFSSGIIVMWRHMVGIITLLVISR